MMAKFLNIGHRGASAYKPENTIESLREAVARNADMVEFDLRRTLDGVIVLYHNRTAMTLSGKRKSVSRMSYHELSRIAADRGFTLARFEDVLRTIGRLIPMCIEIKVRGIEADVVRLLRRFPPGHKPMISSFLPWVVWRIKILDRGLRTALILGQERVAGINILARPVIKNLVSTLGVGSIHLQEAIVTRSVVNRLVDLGVTVFVWTVDDASAMRRFLRIGVDGIITNTPDVLYNVCLEMASSGKPIMRKSRGKIGRFAYAV